MLVLREAGGERVLVCAVVADDVVVSATAAEGDGGLEDEREPGGKSSLDGLSAAGSCCKSDECVDEAVAFDATEKRRGSVLDLFRLLVAGGALSGESAVGPVLVPANGPLSVMPRLRGSTM